jgi:hypothetical protein
MSFFFHILNSRNIFFLFHSVERDDFLVDEPAAFVESTFGHEYMEMWIVAHTLGKWMQHHVAEVIFFQKVKCRPVVIVLLVIWICLRFGACDLGFSLYTYTICIMHAEVEEWTKKARVASVGNYSALIDEAKEVLAQERALRADSGLVTLAPQAVRSVIVVGDIHGDMESLVHILISEEMEKADRIVFLGDYGDRGAKSVEVYYLLLRLKVSIRGKVIMLRGNHEGPMPVRPHDLPSLFIKRYGANGNTLYKKIKEFWGYLPHAVVVEGRYLMLHGGLPIKVFSAKDFGFAHETASSNFEEILWSDPVEGKGYFQSSRGAGMLFGEDITDKVLRVVGVKTLIRSHEACEGVKVQQRGRILTLFSRKGAPYSNTRAAYLLLDDNALREAKDAAELARAARVW